MMDDQRPVTLMTEAEARTRYENYCDEVFGSKTAWPSFTFSGWLQHKNIHITDSDTFQPVAFVRPDHIHMVTTAAPELRPGQKHKRIVEEKS